MRAPTAVEAPLAERLARYGLKQAAHYREKDPRGEAASRLLLDFFACVLGAGPNAAAWSDNRSARLAVCAHACDQDDLHLQSMTHPGGVIWSAVTACAVERGSTIGDSLAAATVGYEVMVRLAEAFDRDHRTLWHATTVAGVVGAAAAAAKLFSRDEHALIDAVGHASSVAGGSSQAQVEKTATLLVHRAYAVSMGVACARAASSGLTGIRHGLDGGRGAYANISETDAGESILRPRDTAALEETGFRLYAATGFAHSAIDAALVIAPLPPDQIERIVVSVSPPSALSIASNPAPSSDDEAWWSIEHAVANCLVHGQSEPLRLGLSRDDGVHRLCRLMTVTAIDAGWRATVEVTMKDGRSLKATQTVPRGHGDHRPTDEELIEKFERLTGDRAGSSLLAALRAAPLGATLSQVIAAGLGSSGALTLAVINDLGIAPPVRHG